MAAAAPRRTDQQDARPARRGQFNLTPSQPHGGPLADEPLRPKPRGGLLAKSTQGLVQGDRIRSGGRGRLLGSGIGRSIGRVENGEDAQWVFPRGRDGQETSAALDRRAVVGHSSDRGGANLARQTRRRRAKRGGDGLGRADGGAGMVGAGAAQKPLSRRPQPLLARPVEKNDRQVFIQHVDWLFCRVEQPYQLGGVDACFGHGENRNLTVAFFARANLICIVVTTGCHYHP